MKSRPRLVAMCGLVDVDTYMRDDEKTGDRFVARPTFGYGIMVDAKGIHLVAVEESKDERPVYRGTGHLDLRVAWKKMTFKILKSKSASVQGKDVLKWKVSASGKSVKGSVGGKSFSFPPPKPVETGFSGLWIDGPGHVSFMKVSAR